MKEEDKIKNIEEYKQELYKHALKEKARRIARNKRKRERKNKNGKKK